jgi:TetR/AcrR family transcriptional regulator, cholesterol catabolism regulator
MTKPSAQHTVKHASTTKRRNRRQAEVTRAAAGVFAQKGYTAASIQDIAQKVGVLKGSLYYYIDSKEDLLWWIIEDVHEHWSKILEGTDDLQGEPVERIHTFIRLQVEWYLRNIEMANVFFREWQYLSGERLSLVRERRHLYESVIRDLLASARAAGDVSPDLDLRYATRFVLAAVNAVPEWYRPLDGEPVGAIAAANADMTVGLLSGTQRLPARAERS